MSLPGNVTLLCSQRHWHWVPSFRSLSGWSLPPKPRQRRFRIFRTPGGYRVRGDATEEELRAAGIKPDAVVEFEDA